MSDHVTMASADGTRVRVPASDKGELNRLRARGYRALPEPTIAEASDQQPPQGDELPGQPAGEPGELQPRDVQPLEGSDTTAAAVVDAGTSQHDQQQHRGSVRHRGRDRSEEQQ